MLKSPWICSLWLDKSDDSEVEIPILWYPQSHYTWHWQVHLAKKMHYVNTEELSHAADRALRRAGAVWRHHTRDWQHRHECLDRWAVDGRLWHHLDWPQRVVACYHCQRQRSPAIYSRAGHNVTLGGKTATDKINHLTSAITIH